MYINCTHCTDTFQTNNALNNECPACREVLQDCKSIWQEDRLDHLQMNMILNYVSRVRANTTFSLADMIADDDAKLEKFEFRYRNIMQTQVLSRA